jgi:hypothetical protein
MSNTATRVIWICVAIAAGIGFLSSNPFLTPASTVLLPVLAYLTWRKGEPPALMFACAMQWLQAAAAIFYANFYRSSLAEAFGGMELETATWLSLGGVLALALGMRLGLLRARSPQPLEFAAEALKIDVNKAFSAYSVSFLLSFACTTIAVRIPALTQALLFLGAVKWVFVFVLGFCVLEQKRGYFLLALCVTLEFAVGILGFFSGFKSVFFVLFIAAITSPVAWRGRRLLLLGGLAALLLLLGSTWTAVKSDYREFLNQGLRTQEVLVPLEERVTKLDDLLTGFGTQQLTEGFETMILRISYVQFFALTMKNVPENVPYENGALWGGAIKHILTPRVLFPNKPAIDDSERTSLYTGLDVAGAEQGTSIGIGYFAESYVDFGPVFMFFPIVLLGVGYGVVYRLFVIKARYKLLGGAIVTSIMVFGGSAIETSNIKIIGGNVMALIVMSGLYLAAAPALMRWMEKRVDSHR